MNFGTEQKNMMLNFLFYPSPPHSYPSKKVEKQIIFERLIHSLSIKKGNNTSHGIVFYSVTFLSYLTFLVKFNIEQRRVSRKSWG